MAGGERRQRAMSIPTLKRLAAGLALAALAGCSFFSERPDGAPGGRRLNPAKIKNAVPRVEPRSKYGNMKTYKVNGKRYHVLDSGAGFEQRGIASWYGTKFHGRKTSSGEPYDMYAMTAAHKTLPLPSYLEVRNLENGRKIIVRVNDRGPFHANRIVDLSYAAAVKMDMIKTGTALVEIRAIDPPAHNRGGAPISARERAAGSRRTAGFYIQVGAFSEISNAKQLKSRLKPLKKPIRIARARVNRRTVFRVQIGPLSNTETADRLVGRLPGFDIHNHHIVLE